VTGDRVGPAICTLLPHPLAPPPRPRYPRAMTLPILIVGAGLAGLSLAWHLDRRGLPVRVLEASGRPGGVVRTLQDGPLRLEQGPQSLRAAGAATARLVEGLGLRDRVVGSSPAARRRYLLHRGRLRPLPTGPLSLLRGGPLRRRALLRALAEPLLPARSTPGESVHDLVARRLGPGLADPVLDAFVAGIYAGDARQMEAEAGFPALARAEREHGSVLVGLLRRPRAPRPDWLPRGSFTFDEGVEVLPRTLAAALGDRLALGRPAERVVRHGDGLMVETAAGPEAAAAVVVTAPPWRDRKSVV
jgi:protoporphyrinogen/coproporphyrinogen III oxidase